MTAQYVLDKIQPWVLTVQFGRYFTLLQIIYMPSYGFMHIIAIGFTPAETWLIQPNTLIHCINKKDYTMSQARSWNVNLISSSCILKVSERLLLGRSWHSLQLNCFFAWRVFRIVLMYGTGTAVRNRNHPASHYPKYKHHSMTQTTPTHFDVNFQASVVKRHLPQPCHKATT